MLDSRAQLNGRGVLLSLLVAGVGTLLLGFHNLTLSLQGGGGLERPHLISAVGVMCLGAYFHLRRRSFMQPELIMGLVVLSSIVVVAAVTLNGLPAVLLLPAGLVFTHLLLHPNDAAWISGLTVTLALAALFLMWPAVPLELKARAAMTSLMIMAFMQMFGRHSSGMAQRFGKISLEMSTLVTHLDAELADAQSQREAARTTDPDTGLPNRAGFDIQLGERLASMPQGSRALVVSLRLLAWREALTLLPPQTQAALVELLVRRLREIFGETSLLACTGPAEFTLALAAGDFEGEDPAALLDGVFSRLQQSVTYGTANAVTRPRLGMSHFPFDGVDVASLVFKAELARVSAEQAGEDRPVRFESGMLTQASDRAQSVRDIGRGIALSQFELFYQPIVDTRGGPIRKAEGLIRWNHPERGRVSPGAFIPLAEQTDLIIPLTDWVLRQAVDQVRSWRQDLHPGFQISVNMPPAYLMHCVKDPARSLDQLAGLDAPPQSIVLEITEGVMLNVTPELEQALSILRYLGFQIALDDFGIGYSSFGQLDRLPLDFLKIDKTFVDHLEAGPQKRAVCGAIVRVAHELGFQVVAEGVETRAQHDHLAQMGCDYVQGYVVSKPLPAAEMLAWAKQSQVGAA